MFVEPPPYDPDTNDQQQVDAIVARGPGGAFAVAGTAVALVVAMWVAFYLMVFVARGGA